MLHSFFALISALTFAQQPAAKSEDPGFLTNRKQITFVGTRSGEGYFSPDGKELIYQSERIPGNPFYQIYRMNLESGDSQLVSTGKGKTTCAWFHPSMKKALFSSTHLDPNVKSKIEKEYESRKSTVKQKYSWSYDEYFDLFEVDLKTKKLKQLTKDKGYDAEASYSPDGQWIAFASNRSGYKNQLSPEDKKIFEQDPSYMMEIYIMKADGTNVRQLTNTKGYDGGPFFSADGKKITWRRFAPNGQSAEIMSMNVDGSDQKQLTRLNSMSWAPYFHPSGDYIIFTTNLLGYSNFELYMVDSEGKKDPVRVTALENFDGLPVFTPDGKKVAWTHHNEKGESQIYMGDWDDQKARVALGLPAAAAPKPPQEPIKLSGDFSTDDSKRIINFLASEQFGGRATGSPEEKLYSAELEKLMKEMGLTPVTKSGFQQTFDFAAGVKLGSKESMAITIDGKKIDLKVGENYNPISFSATGTFSQAPIIFAGYGIKAPAGNNQALYDSYADIDVHGKWVLAFRDIPESVEPARRVYLNTFARLHHKALIAREAGALGLILINGPNSATKTKLMKLRFDGAKFAGTALPVLNISDEIAEILFKPTGKSLKSVQDELDRGEMKTPELKNASAVATVDLQEEKATGINVIGQIKVPGAKETIIIGAHGDHLGKGITGSSLAVEKEQGQAHLGADDNASGVASVFQIAKAFRQNQKSLKPKRNIVFAIWSGEEIGLIGSTHFAKNLAKIFPGQKVVGYLNLDMVGRLRDQLFVQGIGSASEWPSLFEKISSKTPLSLSLMADPYVPSDAMAFYLQGVPAVQFFTGSHGEYHTPRDRPELINYEGLGEISKIVYRLAGDLAAGKQKLTYQKVESSRKSMEGRSFRVYIGTIPDYTQEGVKGVRISGTSKNSPAEKSGLKAGDIIVEVGGTKIENLYDYVYVLQALKPNETVAMKIKRGSAEEQLSVTPTLKE